VFDSSEDFISVISGSRTCDFQSHSIGVYETFHREMGNDLKDCRSPKLHNSVNALRVTCYTTSLYVVHFKRALNSVEAQAFVNLDARC
jgi:hypothetical protein